MSDSSKFYKPDRRKNLRAESTDRRKALRPTVRTQVLKVIVAVIAVLLVGVLVYIMNPKLFAHVLNYDKFLLYFSLDL